jgi:hypothetical protein
MDAYDEIFDEEQDEIMRDVRMRQAEVAEMYKRFNADPRLWAEHHAKLEAEGCKFVYEPANKLH